MDDVPTATSPGIDSGFRLTYRWALRGWALASAFHCIGAIVKQVVIENPIINSPFEEPQRHFRFDDNGITDEIVESRRISAYFIPIAYSGLQVSGAGLAEGGRRSPAAFRETKQGGMVQAPAKCSSPRRRARTANWPSMAGPPTASRETRPSTPSASGLMSCAKLAIPM
jgi:hypothetical protein